MLELKGLLRRGYWDMSMGSLLWVVNLISLCLPGSRVLGRMIVASPAIFCIS